MKNLKWVAALSLCAIVFVSCDFSLKKQKVANPLIGQWKIDSIATKDSNHFGVLLLAMSLQNRDSSNYDLTFATDTMTLLQKDTATKLGYQFNPAKSEVVLSEDSTVFSFYSLNDRIITLTSKDSTILFLTKE